MDNTATMRIVPFPPAALPPRNIIPQTPEPNTHAAMFQNTVRKITRLPIFAAAVAAAAVAAAIATGCSTSDGPPPWYYPNTEEHHAGMHTLREHHIRPTDWHVHIFRGGMTPEKAIERASHSGIRSAVVENHGVEWPLSDDAKLRDYIAKARAAKDPFTRKPLPVGIQVNDRDWHKQIAPELLAQLDYVLADTMIMGVTPDGKRQQRLWQLKEPIRDADAWFEKYFAHCLRVVNEPISILANPTYLPDSVAAQYDRLWTPERMTTLIEAAKRNNVAIEIQAASPFPKIAFIKLAKKLGAKFTFGTNNFTDKPQNLSAWFRAVEEAGLTANDFMIPQKKF
ncbi:MAG: hypothetical protein LBT53_03930 [Puniceicoccales bacterium]|jgi:histidinol phosphatase-like PHP family hydrolase|nr:hypothetical protein [Puniceicoccales bacterium]